MHSASAMADTNMEKKDFARRRRKIRRAKHRRENLLFRRTKQYFRRAITCRQLLFCATKKFIRRTKIPSREYKLASRKVHASSRRLKYFVAQGCTAVTLYATTYFRRAKTHLHIGAKIKEIRSKRVEDVSGRTKVGTVTNALENCSVRIRGRAQTISSSREEHIVCGPQREKVHRAVCGDSPA
ncbi:hypothetical protein L3X38_042163 [Prunus dulcis]|uniref:Uncharacterized protein n=1 Tax=Prunus dulcis TaxID=3755 RepID=A0AAD4UUF3_PRUDU|nr:hypothetical protein L3X38_042163 [Prunus dulcis]